jgi:hypothetical protein
MTTEQQQLICSGRDYMLGIEGIWILKGEEKTLLKLIEKYRKSGKTQEQIIDALYITEEEYIRRLNDLNKYGSAEEAIKNFYPF